MAIIETIGFLSLIYIAGLYVGTVLDLRKEAKKKAELKEAKRRLYWENNPDRLAWWEERASK